MFCVTLFVVPRQELGLISVISSVRTSQLNLCASTVSGCGLSCTLMFTRKHSSRMHTTHSLTVCVVANTRVSTLWYTHPWTYSTPDIPTPRHSHPKHTHPQMYPPPWHTYPSIYPSLNTHPFLDIPPRKEGTWYERYPPPPKKGHETSPSPLNRMTDRHPCKNCLPATTVAGVISHGHGRTPHQGEGHFLCCI